MNLEQQQKLFIANNAAIINYVKNNFVPFNSSMLDSYFLAQVYIDAVNNNETALNNDNLNNYEFLFWFWVNKRLQRMSNNLEADRISRALDAMRQDKSGQFDFSSLFGFLGNIPTIIIVGLIIYGISVLKK